MQPDQMNPNVARGVCADCPFYQELSGETSWGETLPAGTGGVCRRRSPSLERNDMGDGTVTGLRRGLYPMTTPGDWCGEHPLRVAAYGLGVEDYRDVLIERGREMRRAARRAGSNPPAGGSSGSKA